MADWVIWVWAILPIALMQVLNYLLVILMVSGLLAFVIGMGLAVWRREWGGWRLVLTLAASQLLLPLTTALERWLPDPTWLIWAFLLLQLAASAWIAWAMKKAITAGIMLAWSNMACALILAVLAFSLTSGGYI